VKAPAALPAVALLLPSVLVPIAGRRTFRTNAGTVREVLEAAFAEVPVLRHHLTLPTGELRPHILCLVNGDSLPRAEAPGRALADGDEVEIHQAISGG
jgi:sulfur carrier protein ThiS